MENIRHHQHEQPHQIVELINLVQVISHIITQQIRVCRVDHDIHVHDEDVVEQLQQQHVRKIVQQSDDVVQPIMEIHVRHRQQVQ